MLDNLLATNLLQLIATSEKNWYQVIIIEYLLQREMCAVVEKFRSILLGKGRAALQSELLQL